MATYSDIFIEQGADFSVAIDGSTLNSVEVTDFSTFTFFGQIRRTYTSSTAVNFYFDMTQAAEGRVFATISAAVTSAMKAQRYVYDIFVRNTATGFVQKLVEGQVEVSPAASTVPIL